MADRDIAAEWYGLRRVVLVDYLKSAVEVCDWHAASDAANDLRVLEAAFKAREPKERR